MVVHLGRETTLDEMERLVRELRVMDEDIATRVSHHATARDELWRAADTIATERERRITVKARLLELAQWINT